MIRFIKGAAVIGKRGRELHPALKDILDGYITIVCGCPNTKNGLAAANCTFLADVEPTCKRSRKSK